MRRAARIDRNQPEIVAALRKAGAFVEPLHAVGGGVPDLLVCYRCKWQLVEVKDSQKPPSERRLTSAQQAWHQACGGVVHVVLTAEDALQAIGAIDRSDALTDWALQNLS